MKLYELIAGFSGYDRYRVTVRSVVRNLSFETKDGALQRRFSCAAMRRGDGRSCSHMQGGRPESVCACCDGRLARSELRDCSV